MLLTELEADVFELIKQGASISDIHKELGKCRQVVHQTVNRSHDVGAISIGNDKMTPLISNYIEASLGDVTTSRNSKGDIDIEVPEQLAMQIKELASKTPRRSLARILNVSKIELNLMLIKLGFGS